MITWPMMSEAAPLIPYVKESAVARVARVISQDYVISSNSVYSDYKKITGNKLPNHESLILAGRNATTPLVGEFRRLVSYNLPNSTFIRNVNGGVDCSQNHWGFSPVLTIPTNSALQNESIAGAIAQLNGKINYYQRPFSAQIFTGEIRETLAFLRSPLKRSLALVSSAKDTLLKLAAGRPLLQVLRSSDRLRVDFSKSWLEFRFAVLPVLYDMKTILEVLERDFFLNDKLTSSWIASDTSSSTLQAQSWTHGTSTIQREITLTSRTTIKCGFIRELQSNLKGLTEILDENITDFSEIAVTTWELTTLSWLVDYFVNVQQVLEGFSYNYESLLSWSSVSTKLTYRYTDTAIAYALGSQRHSWKLQGYSPPFMTYENTRLTRSVLSSTIPPLVFTIPGSGVKLANIAALVSSKLKF